MEVRIKMPSVKEKMVEAIQSQPEDASYEEIMRELADETLSRCKGVVLPMERGKSNSLS